MCSQYKKARVAGVERNSSRVVGNKVREVTEW